MLLPPALKYPRRKRRTVTPAPPPPPVLGPVLTQGLYIDGTTPAIRLTFDRDIDVTAYNGNVVVVEVGHQGFKYHAAGMMSQPTSQSVQVELISFAPFAGTGVWLTAPEACLILDVNDGEPWAGVANVELPYT